jgi:uncharacterized membrane protein
MSPLPDNPAPDLDRVAVVLSGLCLLHCLALPLVIVALPFIAELAETHWHTPMLLIAVPVSTIAIVIGYRRHGNRLIVAAGALGLALLIIGATVAHAHYGATVDRTLTIAGSLLLAAVHWQNSRQLRQSPARNALA